MKRFFAFLLACLLCSVMIGCGQTENTSSNTSQLMDMDTIGEHTTMVTAFDQTEELVGFTIEAPETYRDKKPEIAVLEERIIQLGYDAGELGNILVRKAKGEEDLSGDTNTYDVVKTETVGGKSVRLKGNEQYALVAIWQKGGYSYSITCQGLAYEEMLALVEQIG